jgi:hypothetical protein
MSVTETKIRHLVNEIAKDIVEVDELLKQLNITREDYLRISGTRTFREALSVAEREWKSADNTPKRVKHKAAAIVEELILNVFFTARDSTTEPLSAKVKALEAIAKIGGLGALEPSQAAQSGLSGNTFNLSINYSEGPSEVINLGAVVPVIEVDYNSDEFTMSESLKSDSRSEEVTLGGVSSIFADDAPEDL